MATGYHIGVGYNSSASSREDVWKKLKETAIGICKKPEQILDEDSAVMLGLDPIPEEYIDGYRLPWKDLTIKILEENRELETENQIMQMASGCGEGREFKERLRRAFCRIIMRKMHALGMEITITVA